MIDFTRAFDSAWERMMIILFRPFDLGKWCVIGLSAFLAGLLSGGNGANFSYNQNFDYKNPGAGFNFSDLGHNAGTSLPANPFVGLQLGVVILIAVAVVLFVLAVMLLCLWLGMRGQFLLIDNIVRNRGAISEPWARYGRAGQNAFLFYLLFMLISFLLFLPILIVMLIICVPLFLHHRWPVGGEIAALIFLVLAYFAMALFLGIVGFLFREWALPIMFRQGLTAREAFFEVLALMKRHPGPTALFLVLRFCIGIGAFFAALLVCCGTCCIGLIPYVGTVLLLPVIIYTRCFSLDCLAQLDPRYDAWTVDVLPAPTAPLPVSPPPPLG